MQGVLAHLVRAACLVLALSGCLRPAQDEIIPMSYAPQGDASTPQGDAGGTAD